MDAVPTLPPDRSPPGVNKAEDQFQLNAQAKERPMGDIRTSQRHQENQGPYTNAASPQLASPLLVVPRHRRILDRHSGAERTQLTWPGLQKIDRPEQRQDDKTGDLKAGSAAPAGAGGSPESTLHGC